MSNITAFESGQWNSKPAWKLPSWCEPIMVASILFLAMFTTRRRGFRIFNRTFLYTGYLDRAPEASTEYLLVDRIDGESEDSEDITTKDLPYLRSICCWKVEIPSTSRFRNNLHSRVLQRFPFLIEMFYWIINYAFYRMTSVLSSRFFAGQRIWDVAQAHGIAVLEAEENSIVRFVFPIRERDVQQWFMNGHQDVLTVLNKCYALIHIPGTVLFISWYYYVAPSFDTFAVVRRTMTLTNFCAFVTFVVYPYMPPRLLPDEYGFLDTVRHDDAQSVWMSGKFVNQLAAMPSMHFGYAFCIGMTMIYHPGLFRRFLENSKVRETLFWITLYFVVGVGYPAFILIIIVATANHYWMDAVVAICFVIFFFFCNRAFYVFIPLEDLLLYAIRVDRPKPTTGCRHKSKAALAKHTNHAT